MALAACRECGKEVSSEAKACPHCGAPINGSTEPQPLRGKPQRKTETMGTGCVVQGLGVLLLFWFPIGTVLGVVLLVMGSRMAVYYICSECKTKLGEKGAKVCPACRAALR